MTEAAPETVIVTGASRGVGLAIARRLAETRFRVVAVARNEGPELAELCAAFASKPGAGEIVFRAFDLLQVDEIASFVRQLKSEFGTPFGLVNNAALVRLNVLSPIVLTKYVARGMMTAGRGRIVNIASIVATTGFNGLSVYGATKASLIGFTRSLARELGRLDITVNTVAPGFMQTEMTQAMGEADRDRVARRSALQRLVAPDDVAQCVLYLLSDAGRNVTGSVLTVDAGATA